MTPQKKVKSIYYRPALVPFLLLLLLLHDASKLCKMWSREAREKKAERAQRLSVGYAQSLCVAAHQHMQRNQGCTLVFSAEVGEFTHTESSLLWTECINPFSQWDKQRSTAQRLWVSINKSAGQDYNKVQQQDPAEMKLLSTTALTRG